MTYFSRLPPHGGCCRGTPQAILAFCGRIFSSRTGRSLPNDKAGTFNAHFSTYMTLALALLALLLVAGYVLLFVSLRDAPEGYEDADGFHSLWCNKRAELQDVSCIWTLAKIPMM